IAIRLAGCVPEPFPAKDIEARHAEPRQRRAHEIGHGAEIFHDNLRSRLAEDGEHLLAEPKLVRLFRRYEKGVAAAQGTAVRTIEADDKIDPIAVEQARVAPGSLPQPPEICSRDRLPAIDRHAPVLTGRTELIGRHTNGGIESELLRPRPDIG